MPRASMAEAADLISSALGPVSSASSGAVEFRNALIRSRLSTLSPRNEAMVGGNSETKFLIALPSLY